MTASAEDRTLVLVRHAKAEQGGYDADHERELTPRGHRDAAEAGRWLNEQGIGVDEVLCSTSTRTQQTCEGIWEAGCSEADVRHEHGIYNASAERLLDIAREADHDANVVMMVGHAPGIPVLASLLADGEGSDRAHDLMSEGFPTTGIAILRFSGAWADLAPGVARLDRFHVARAADRDAATR
ncbi:SixA phosphatase family protein [Knoellia subterranea]|uniref:Phosphohistidine phosphatase n=1 Tax=Knoellia subterranea KCTC 19937 TaxID=1385521 RepID=A0A0A0JJY8_9MICO|nr:histidine phosphatase family protein [Knoellia subterranea]KGN37039.1 phosphohistidine phosphatase [Knoellia subterranea KCTC 19937]